ncbi:hypothetical protein ACWNT8_02460 [Pigmentibacter ruber]
MQQNLIECCTNGTMEAVENSMMEAIKIVKKCLEYKVKRDLDIT